MRKFTLALALAAVMALPATAALAGNGNAPGHANAEGVVRGVSQDANATWLGDIEYLFNPAGYHFWLTPTATASYYTAGHSYHNIYKYNVEDTTSWCGPVHIPDRKPYNAAGTDGQNAYFKIWDVTTETWACGSEG